MQPHVPRPVWTPAPRPPSSGSGLAVDDTGFCGESKRRNSRCSPRTLPRPLPGCGPLAVTQLCQPPASPPSAGVDSSYPLASLRGEDESMHLRHRDPAW